MASKKPRLFDVAHGTGHGDYDMAVIPSRLGGFLAAGTGLQQDYGSLARVALTGEVVWAVNAPNYGGRWTGIAELSDGRIAVCADYSTYPVRVLDSQGKVLFTLNAGWGDPHAIKVMPNDGLAVVGSNSPEIINANIGRIATYTDQAQPVWDLKPSGLKTCQALTVRANADLEVWCIGANSSGKDYDMIRVVVSPAVQVLASDHFATPTDVINLSHNIDADGNTYIAATLLPSLSSSAKSLVHLYKFDAKGSLVWQRIVTNNNKSLVALSIAITSSGPVLVGNADRLRNSDLSSTA